MRSICGRKKCRICHICLIFPEFRIFAPCMRYLLESPMRFFAPLFGGFSLFYYLCTQKRN